MSARRHGRPPRSYQLTREAKAMLTSYYVACPHDHCGWTGNQIPSKIPGGAAAEIAPHQHAWFLCPEFERVWEAVAEGDDVAPVPLAAVESS